MTPAPKSGPAHAGTTVRIRAPRGRRIFVVASASASLVLALVALVRRSGGEPERALAPSSEPAAAKAPPSQAAVPPENAYAIPPGVVGAAAVPGQSEDDADAVAPRGRPAARKVTMAAREPRVGHERKQAAARASTSEAAPASPPPLEGTTRTRVRLVDDAARVRILE